jgi:GT2 family glycosyltransferase
MSAAEAGRVIEVDLESIGPEGPDLPGCRLLYVLLRFKGRPVGRLVLDDSFRPDGAEDFRRAALEASSAGMFYAEMEAAPSRGAFAALAPPNPSALPPSAVSVVVATRNRPTSLDACLAALRSLVPAPGEIVVADSASSSAAEVARVAAGHRARVVRVDRPGLSLARNAGAHAATGAVLAFLDDDCRVDPGWLGALCRGFADDAVMAVAGQLLPAELRTEAQTLFLRYSHMDRRGFVPHRFQAAVAESAHWPLDVWRIGSGGNLAIRATAFERIGGFRLSLGLGTAARGGEDLFALWSILSAGLAVVYRPDAVAWHSHHPDLPSLHDVLFGYGVGHAAYLRAARISGARRGQVARYRASFYSDRLARLARSLVGLSQVPPGLVLREVSGSLVGGLLGRSAEREAAS